MLRITSLFRFMKITQKLTSLAFLLTMLHIITRGILSSFSIIPLQVVPTLQYFLLFVSELAYLLVLLFLAAVLMQWNARPAAWGMLAFVLLSLYSFCISTAFKTNLLSLSEHTALLQVIPVIPMLGVLVFMMFMTFRITPSSLGLRFRIFFIAVILGTLLRSAGPYLSQQATSVTMIKITSIVTEIIGLLPVFAVFFIIQKVWLMVKDQK